MREVKHKQVELGASLRAEIQRRVILGTSDYAGVAPPTFIAKADKKGLHKLEELWFRPDWSSRPEGAKTDTASLIDAVDMDCFNIAHVSKGTLHHLLELHLPHEFLRKALRYHGGTSLHPVFKEQIGKDLYLKTGFKAYQRIGIKDEHILVRHTTSLRDNTILTEIQLQVLLFSCNGRQYTYHPGKNKIRQIKPAELAQIEAAIADYNAIVGTALSAAELAQEKDLMQQAIDLQRQVDREEKAPSERERTQSSMQAVAELRHLRECVGDALNEEVDKDLLLPKRVKPDFPPKVNNNSDSYSQSYMTCLKTIDASSKVSEATIERDVYEVEEHAPAADRWALAFRASAGQATHEVECHDARGRVRHLLELDLLKRQLQHFAARQCRDKQKKQQTAMKNLGKTYHCGPAIALFAQINIFKSKNRMHFDVDKVTRKCFGSDLQFDVHYLKNNQQSGGQNSNTERDRYSSSWTL